MRRRTGAIFLDTRPETIITSACRGLARKTSEPNRARSLRAEVAFIISIAQQARPNVAGHKDDFRAQLIKESSRVVKTSGRASAMMFSSPINNLTSGCASSSCLCLTGFQIGQSSSFCLCFLASFLAPIKRALLYNIDVADKQQANEHHHLEIDKVAH